MWSTMQDESVLVFPVWPQTGYAVGTAVGVNKDCMDSIPLCSKAVLG